MHPIISLPLLIIDLDETLIYSTPENEGSDYDFRITGYHVKRRPGLETFLWHVAVHFKIAVWSSATEDYVTEIVDAVFPQDIPLAFVWGRKKTTPRYSPGPETGEDIGYQSPVFMKRLKKIKKLGYSLDRTLIVDDKPAGLRENFGNTIIIPEFNGDQQDSELIHLGKYLMKIKDTPNFRKLEKRNWRSETLSEKG